MCLLLIDCKFSPTALVSRLAYFVKGMTPENTGPEEAIYIYYLLLLLEPAKHRTGELAAFCLEKFRDKAMNEAELKPEYLPDGTKPESAPLKAKYEDIMLAFVTLQETELYAITGLVNMHSLFSLQGHENWRQIPHHLNWVLAAKNDPAKMEAVDRYTQSIVAAAEYGVICLGYGSAKLLSSIGSNVSTDLIT